MEMWNPKFDLTELALEIGRGDHPVESWALFLAKLAQVAGCDDLSVWRLNQADNKLYLYSSAGRLKDDIIRKSGLDNIPSRNFAIRLNKKQLSENYLQAFGGLRDTLVLIRLDGYGFLALEDPRWPLEELAGDDVFVRICKRQIEAAARLEQQLRLKFRNKKKLRIIQKLRDWRGTYAELFENINHAVLVTDSNGVITNANKEARELLGFPRSTLRQARLHHFVHEKSIESFQNLILRTKESGAVFNHECDFRNSNGMLIHCLVNCSLVRKSGTFSGFNISLQNITRRKKAESLLEQIRQTQEQVLSNLPVGICLTDMDGNVTTVNPHFFKIFEVCKSEDDLHNFKYEDHFLNPQREERRVSELNEKMEPVTNDVIFLKNGRIVSRDFVPIKFQGKPIGKLWTFKDITEEYNAHLELQASEKRYRGVIENLSLGILEWSPDKRVVAVYPSFMKIVNVDPVRILGKRSSDIFVTGQDIFEEIAGGTSIEAEFRLPGAATKWMLISTVPVYEQYQKIRGYLSVLYDITDRKMMEEQLLEAQQRALEDRDYERYFLANMSHEIRTPLNAIAGMTHLLRNTRLSSAQRQYVDSLESSTGALLHLLNDVLDISKMEAGQMELETREFNLETLCKNLVSSYQARTKGEPVQLLLQFDKRIDRAVMGDPVRLQQILGNLLSNACKFTREGAIVLELSLVENRADVYHVKFAVHDTGIGISEEKQERIFEKFKQADAATGNDFGGTGLGLSIVKQLVELHGGFIEVDSREGEGSSFSFIIDLKKSDRPAIELLVSDEKESSASKELQNGTFLIVDDNPTNLKLMARLFEMWGCGYELAMSGKEAIVKTRGQQFDLILMDLRMPGMDGCETTRRIRTDALNQNRKTPVVALSAAILPDDRRQALKAGMDDFMPKPFSPPQLLECMHRHLKFKLQPASVVKTGEPKNTSAKDFARAPANTPGLEYLLAFSDGDKKFVQDIITTFLDDAPAAIESMERHLTEGNNRKAANIIHRFKPNLETLGLIDLKNDAVILENELKETSSSDAEYLMRMCKPFISDLRQALAALRRSLKEL